MAFFLVVCGFVCVCVSVVRVFVFVPKFRFPFSIQSIKEEVCLLFRPYPSSLISFGHRCVHTEVVAAQSMQIFFHVPIFDMHALRRKSLEKLKMLSIKLYVCQLS